MNKKCAEKAIMREVQGKVADTEVFEHGKQDTMHIAPLAGHIVSESLKDVTDRTGLMAHAAILLAVIRNMDMACKSCCGDNCNDNDDEGDIEWR